MDNKISITRDSAELLLLQELCCKKDPDYNSDFTSVLPELLQLKEECISPIHINFFDMDYVTQLKELSAFQNLLACEFITLKDSQNKIILTIETVGIKFLKAVQTDCSSH